MKDPTVEFRLTCLEGDVAALRADVSTARANTSTVRGRIESLPTTWRMIAAILGGNVALAGMLILFSDAAFSTPRGSQCRPALTVHSSCFIVDGRLSFYKGTPSWRIWRVKTRRLFGVLDTTGTEAEDPGKVLPKNVWTLMQNDPDRLAIRGMFDVCPLTSEKLREMQMVCLRGHTTFASSPSMLNA